MSPPGTQAVLMTEDFSPIEPDVSELKFYAKGSGQAVLAVDVPGGTDREELVSCTHWPQPTRPSAASPRTAIRAPAFVVRSPSWICLKGPRVG